MYYRFVIFPRCLITLTPSCSLHLLLLFLLLLEHQISKVDAFFPLS